MAEHFATIHWQRGEQPFADRLYSRAHTLRFDGGAVVTGAASPHNVKPSLTDPAGVDPEEAFVAALSSCHMLWFLDIACRAGWIVDDYRDAAVGAMGRGADGRLAMTVVTLRPAVRFGGSRRPGRDEIERLHHAAHAECFIANSVKSELRCEPVEA